MDLRPGYLADERDQRAAVELVRAPDRAARRHRAEGGFRDALPERGAAVGRRISIGPTPTAATTTSAVTGSACWRGRSSSAAARRAAAFRVSGERGRRAMTLRNLPLVAGNLCRAAWNLAAKRARAVRQRLRRASKHGARNREGAARRRARPGRGEPRRGPARVSGTVRTSRYWGRVRARTMPKLRRELAVRARAVAAGARQRSDHRRALALRGRLRSALLGALSALVRRPLRRGSRASGRGLARRVPGAGTGRRRTDMSSCSTCSPRRSLRRATRSGSGMASRSSTASRLSTRRSWRASGCRRASKARPSAIRR